MIPSSWVWQFYTGKTTKDTTRIKDLCPNLLTKKHIVCAVGDCALGVLGIRALHSAGPHRVITTPWFEVPTLKKSSWNQPGYI